MCLYSFNRGAQLVETFINILITPVDLIYILNYTFPFRTHRCNQQGNTGSYIRTAHGDSPKFMHSAQTDNGCTVWIAKNNLGTHIEQLVYKKQPAFKHFLMNQHTSFGLGGDNQQHTEQVRSQAGPWDDRIALILIHPDRFVFHKDPGGE